MGVLIQQNIIQPYNLRHVREGGQGRFHIVSQFCDQLASLHEESAQMLCLFLHLLLQMEIQPFVFRCHFPASPHHQKGKGDYHAEGAVLLGICADKRFKVPDGEDAVNEADAVCGSGGKNDLNIRQPHKTAIDGQSDKQERHNGFIP